jgi:hypothetical protein
MSVEINKQFHYFNTICFKKTGAKNGAFAVLELNNESVCMRDIVVECKSGTRHLSKKLQIRQKLLSMWICVGFVWWGGGRPLLSTSHNAT